MVFIRESGRDSFGDVSGKEWWWKNTNVGDKKLELIEYATPEADREILPLEVVLNLHGSTKRSAQQSDLTQNWFWFRGDALSENRSGLNFVLVSNEALEVEVRRKSYGFLRIRFWGTGDRDSVASSYKVYI
ncbi:hypothetical protein ACFXTI_041503 [Malus domestica]